MKTYTMSFADSITHKPDHPERTAKRSLNFDMSFQVWPSRAAMLTSIRMQEQRAPSSRDWKPCKWICPCGVSGCSGLHMNPDNLKRQRELAMLILDTSREQDAVDLAMLILDGGTNENR